MTLQKFFQEIDNDNYIIVDEEGNKKESSSLIAMAKVVGINIRNEKVYIITKEE